MRTVITGRGEGSTAGSGEAAAAAIAGFEGVALDAEAKAAIEAALIACAERAREDQAAYDKGGMAAADAAEQDPGQPFFRSAEPYRGELIPPTGYEEFVPFTPGEPHWTLAGAEIPAVLIALQERLAKGEES